MITALVFIFGMTAAFVVIGVVGCLFEKQQQARRAARAAKRAKQRPAYKGWGNGDFLALNRASK